MSLKSLFDRLSSFFGLILLTPVFLIVAILIRLKMPDGPILFRQQRVGQYGRLFTMYKFRTMTVNHSGSSISVRGESRITPLGAVLRKYKLDELPELWNVLIGDMSLVGPRPDVPGYADRLVGDDRQVLLLKPGITGPASLKYRNEEELLSQQAAPQKYNDEVLFPDKVKINIGYLNNRSFMYDMKIIFYTLIGKDLLITNE
jgi:lipopolysaccharide/colanic/teichoic acid biosynthesis glycosyltransferase